MRRFSIKSDVTNWVVFDEADEMKCVVFAHHDYSLIRDAVEVFRSTAGGLNLDCVAQSWLVRFARIAHLEPRALARNIWGRDSDEARDLVWKLEKYAKRKAVAMRERERGDIAVATALEASCTRIYDSLPDWARSW
jgi:hypothetical protein